MMSSEGSQRDSAHWLHRLTPDEWMGAALAELRQADTALGIRDSRGVVAGAKRAAGMALNAALAARPREGWGRTYVEHLVGLAADQRAPAEVRVAARVVREAPLPSNGLISLRSKGRDEAVIDAARTVMAHAYALVYGSHARKGT